MPLRQPLSGTWSFWSGAPTAATRPSDERSSFRSAPGAVLFEPRPLIASIATKSVGYAGVRDTVGAEPVELSNASQSPAALKQ